MRNFETVTETTPRWWAIARPLFVLLFAGILGLIWLPTLLHLPRYETRDGTLVARSLGARVAIPAGTEVRRQTVELRGRILGSQGSGYCVGRFTVRPLGEARVLTDCSRDALIFDTPSAPVVLTPADPDALLAAWRDGRTAEFLPARRASPTALDFTLTPVLLVLLGLFLVPTPRVRYRVGRDVLEVRTLLRTLRFPLGEVRVRPSRDALSVRVLGTALPGYYTGLFAFTSNANPTVHALATTCRPEAGGLLLEHRDRTYFLTPRDPMALARAIDADAAESREVSQGTLGVRSRT